MYSLFEGLVSDKREEKLRGAVVTDGIDHPIRGLEFRHPRRILETATTIISRPGINDPTYGLYWHRTGWGRFWPIGRPDIPSPMRVDQSASAMS